MASVHKLRCAVETLLPVETGAHLKAPPIEVCHRTDTRTTIRIADGHRRALADRDIQAIHGLQVTTPLRTCLDLGRLTWRYNAIAALDSGLTLGLSRERMVAEAERFRGFRGVRQVWLHRDGQGIYRLDLGSTRVRFAAEFDGEAFHTDELDVRRDEARRRRISSEFGWEVEVFTREIYSLLSCTQDRLVQGYARALQRPPPWSA